MKQSWWKTKQQQQHQQSRKSLRFEMLVSLSMWFHKMKANPQKSFTLLQIWTLSHFAFESLQWRFFSSVAIVLDDEGNFFRVLLRHLTFYQPIYTYICVVFVYKMRNKCNWVLFPLTITHCNDAHNWKMNRRSNCERMKMNENSKTK